MQKENTYIYREREIEKEKEKDRERERERDGFLFQIILNTLANMFNLSIACQSNLESCETYVNQK